MSIEHLTELEQQIDTLIQHCQYLQTENAQLRARIDELAQERDQIKHRNQKAIDKVKNIIAQLKEQTQ